MQVQGKTVKEVLLWSMIAVAIGLLLFNTLAYRKLQQSLPPKDATPEIEAGISLAGLTLKALDGSVYAIPDKGKLLVAFLTTGCDACQTQVAALNDALKSGNYTQVIGVFADLPERVAKFKDIHNPQFLCLTDESGKVHELKLRTFPQTIELHDTVVQRVWVGKQEVFP